MLNHFHISPTGELSAIKFHECLKSYTIPQCVISRTVSCMPYRTLLTPHSNVNPNNQDHKHISLSKTVANGCA